MNFPTFLWVPSLQAALHCSLQQTSEILASHLKTNRGNFEFHSQFPKSQSGDATGIKGAPTLSSPANQSQRQDKEELCKQFVKPPTQEGQEMAKSTAVGLSAAALLMIIAGSSAVPVLATKIRLPSVVPRSSSTPCPSTSYKTGVEAVPLCTARTSVEELSKTDYQDSLLSVFLELTNRTASLQAKAMEYFDAKMVRVTHTHTHTHAHTHTHTPHTLRERYKRLSRVEMSSEHLS